MQSVWNYGRTKISTAVVWKMLFKMFGFSQLCQLPKSSNEFQREISRQVKLRISVLVQKHFFYVLEVIKISLFERIINLAFWLTNGTWKCGTGFSYWAEVVLYVGWKQLIWTWANIGTFRVEEMQNRLKWLTESMCFISLQVKQS